MPVISPMDSKYVPEGLVRAGKTRLCETGHMSHGCQASTPGLKRPARYLMEPKYPPRVLGSAGEASHTSYGCHISN